MSNKKKTENISMENTDEPINLSGNPFQKEKKKKSPPKLNKQDPSYSKIKDIYDDTSPGTGIYLKVKQQKYYKLVSNFLKIVVAGFLILLLINSINIYKRSIEVEKNIKGAAYEGYSKLLEGSKSTTKVQFIEAKTAFGKAIESFNEAENSLWFILEDETIYAHKSSLSSSVKAVLNSGKSFAQAGEYFTEALEELNKIPLYFVSKNEEKSTTVIKEHEDITTILKSGIEKAGLALIETKAARNEIEKINQEILPQEIKGKLSYAKEKIDQLIEVLESIELHFPAILNLLGYKTPHRYLVLLQNNAEIRPSGGFIGSFVYLDINKGLIENLKVEDVYSIDDKYKEVIQPPEDLLRFTSNWRFRDSNYSPDFFFTGKKAAEMLEKEGGPQVDTVIALNQSLLKDFLEITGPIQVGELQNKIAADNYDVIMTYIIEGKIWGKQDPKHVLKVMVPEFKKELLKTENVSKIMSSLYKAVQQKMIMAYSKDSEVQAFLDTLGVTGRIKQLEEKEDFLSVVNMSVGGNKTDLLVEENLTHKTTIDNSGALIDELTISRTHTFDKNLQNKWNKIWDSFGFDHRVVPGYIVDILGRGTNVVLTKIYVPEGSQLLEVKGVDKSSVEVKYDKELNKTYFYTRFSVPPKNTVSITLKYRLPFTLDFSPLDTYKIEVQKQPGSLGSMFTKTVETADPSNGIKPYMYYPEDAYINDENKVSYATNLVYDRYFSVIFGK